MTSIVPLALIVSFLVSTSQAWSLPADLIDKSHFVTEPDFLPTYFIIHNATKSPTSLQPGYIFLDPVHGAPTAGSYGHFYGPQIRDQDGTLIWYGSDTESYSARTRDRERVQDFHVCDYLGSTGQHLCWSEKAENERRKHVVYDSTYSHVTDCFTGLEDEATNMHEFNLVDNGEAYLHSVWPIRTVNLTDYGGPEEGRIWDGCFQEVSLRSHIATFEWCWLDWLPIWETSLYPSGGPNTTNLTSEHAGSGKKGAAWDAWHINAIDKNLEGNYLLSSRHADQILLIAGQHNAQGSRPGTVIWRLGGKGSTIKIQGHSFNFSKQHGVRFISTTEQEIVFSILDNAWEGLLAPSDLSSSGMVISVNNATGTARLISRFRHPEGRLAPSQGIVQQLDNGNTFVAWGSDASFSEFGHDGSLLYYASYTNDTSPDEFSGFTYSYRVFKSSWIGRPSYSPKLVLSMQGCGLDASSPLKAWVSWNGATEVASWRFAASNGRDGPWLPLGTWTKAGFETKVTLSESAQAERSLRWMFPTHVSVEALDAKGNALPNGFLVSEIPMERGGNIVDDCERADWSLLPKLAALGALVVAIELFTHLVVSCLAGLGFALTALDAEGCRERLIVSET